MTGKTDTINKKRLVFFLVGTFLLISLLQFWTKLENFPRSFSPLQTAKIDTLMTDQDPGSTAFISNLPQEGECAISSNQTVVEWKHMYWFPCQLTWRGICIWPIRRKHITYKVTVNEGTPLQDVRGRAIPVAKGKVRQWSVYNAKEWNAIENNPKEKNRYPDYEKIAHNEYVVMVETRYRLFNDVESTLGICIQEP